MQLIDKRFLFVTGKGGVGKTTVSTALALHAAQTGKRVLLAQCNAKDRVGAMLEVPPLNTAIVPIRPNFDAVNMQPAAALEEYGMMVLKVRALYKLIFENRLVSAFLRAAPGLDAWAMLGKAQHHAFEKAQDGSDRYDLVIVDAPATGHGLGLLRVPRVIVDVAPPGPLRKEAERAWELFQDPARSGVLLVTLPEDMPTNETLELAAAVSGELALPIAGLVINGVLPTLFKPGHRPVLETLCEDLSANTPEGKVARAGRARANLEAIQRSCIERLQSDLAVPTWTLPRLPAEALHETELEQLRLRFENRATDYRRD